jgi:hypothetical protein
MPLAVLLPEGQLAVQVRAGDRCSVCLLFSYKCANADANARLPGACNTDANVRAHTLPDVHILTRMRGCQAHRSAHAPRCVSLPFPERSALAPRVRVGRWSGRAAGYTHFTCFTGTKAQTLTQKALARAGS